MDSIFSLLNFGFIDIDNECSQIQDAVRKFSQEKIFPEEPADLIFLGRKASHLWNRDRIFEDRSFTISQLKVIQGKFIHSKNFPSKKSNIILITDTVHSGTELSGILLNFKNRGIKIKKVISYVKNEEGVKNILKLKIINEKNIIGYISTSSEEEYQRYGKSLQLFFRSRITPMDPDLMFLEYETNSTVEPEKVKVLVESLLYSKLKIPIFFEKTEEAGLKTDIAEFKSTPKDGKIYIDFIKQIFSNNDFVSITGITFVLKFYLKEKNLNFTIWVDPDVIVKTDLCSKNITMFLDKSLDPKCQLDEIESSLSENDTKSITCPYCIQEYISKNLLEYLNEKMSNYSLEENNIIKLIRK